MPVNYFAQSLASARKLAAHGFDRQPDEAELAEYAFDQADKLDALIESLGLEARKDVRGRWHVERARQEAV